MATGILSIITLEKKLLRKKYWILLKTRKISFLYYLLIIRSADVNLIDALNWFQFYFRFYKLGDLWKFLFYPRFAQEGKFR
jgi:hypothetical protein